MKEHKSDVFSSDKESTKEEISLKNDEVLSERGKIEAIFGEKESEDMVVDVVSADVVVEDHVMEDVDVVKESDVDGVDESRIKNLKKVEVVVSEGSVEVVKEVVVKENVVKTDASGSDCVDQKSGKEVEDCGGEVEVTESVQEVSDEKNKRETEVLDSKEVSESIEGQVVSVEGLLVGKDKAEDGVTSQILSNEVVDAGKGEVSVNVSTKSTENQAEVEQTKKESFVSTTEATTDDTQKSGNFERAVELDGGAIEETVERPTEPVQEAAEVDCVTSEKTGKDEILDSAQIQDSVTKVDEVITKEGLDGKDEIQDVESEDQSKIVNTETCEKAEVDLKNGEESSTINDSKPGKETEVEDFKMVVEPEIIKGEIDVIDKGDGDQDPSKISQSSIMVSLGLEEVDVVVVDEDLERKNEEQNPEVDQKSEVDVTSKDDNSSATINPEDEGLERKNEEQNSEVDQKAEVDVTSKDDNSSATINPEDEGLERKNEEQNPEVDQKAEVDVTSKDDNSSATINPEDEGLEPENEEQNPEVDVTSKDDNSSATINPDEVTVAQKEPNSDGGILAENQSIDMNIVTDGSKPDVAAYTEPHQTQTEHDVLPANSQFSYEDAHMERGEDVGMDIDEVLGWKDEIPPVQQDELKADPANPINVEMQETEALQLNKTPVSLKQSCYFHSPANEGEYSVSDLVWGKVRSHPWWPGQIFDPSDASEKAMKHHKNDCFLVAYFGDRTFAWNDSAVLKPFRENFKESVDHIDSKAFDNAVHCALQEVSRRVELGLTCSCIPHEIYENIKCQIVENSGIKQESSRRHGVDESANVNSFEPDMLVDYVRLLAKVPYGEGDKMELTIAKAQLSSYARFKGHRQLAEFQSCGDLLEAEQVVKDEAHSEDSSKKRKTLDSISDGSKQSFKVGRSIQKVANQLTGQPEQAEMLSQLHQAAQDPMKGYDFVNNIIPFFNSHRATVLSKNSLDSSNDGRKRKTSNENQYEDFEFDDVNDSYWTDRIIQNNSEENLLQENQNGGGPPQIVSYEQEKQSVKPARRSNKKRFFSSNHEIEAKEQSELIERRRKNLATEVLMKFTEGVYFPSEIHLNKMFRRFGPLMESETEVDRQSGRARVVFKKCSDAEVAHSSAGKFNIFGSINVHYELNYTPLISYKPLPLPVQDPAHTS